MTYDYELYHTGVKGMRWGVRRYQNEDGSLTPAGKTRYAKLGNKLGEKVLTRKTHLTDDPVARKKRIDADIKEADDRVKFYGSKRAAKAAIADETKYATAVTRGQAAVKTAVYAPASGIGGMLLVGLAGGPVGAGIGVGAGAAVGTGLLIANGARKANDFIRRHAKDQIAYTEESEYGHDMVVTFKKRD